jgi:hypothetical protein
MECKNALWFTSSMGTVGVVKAMDERKLIYYFIGVAQGLHEPIDINNIMNIGSRFPDHVGVVLFAGMEDRVVKPIKNSADTL